LKAAAQSALRKDQTIEQLQEAVLASKHEVASLRHQLGLYQSASKEICKVLEKGQLSQES
jgi:ribosomal protein L29